MSNVKTITVDNFSGRLTRYNYGDLNSGFAKFFKTFAADPFGKPRQLTWQEVAIQIDPTYSVITDLIMAGKERVESGVSYMYAIGHTGRLYKIQINDPATYNPNYDNPVLLATLSINSPTFKYGGSIEFFGATEKIYIGHDVGVTSINFDGTGEAFVSVPGNFTQNVPRPLQEFLGKLFLGNGNLLAYIDSTGTMPLSGILSPSFPDNSQVRDLDVSNDGNYLNILVSTLALPDITSITPDTTFLSNATSYIFKYNGIDRSYTTYDSFPSFSMNANIMFGDFQYTFGYDVVGSAVFNPTTKILTPVLTQAPLPNAVDSNGNLVGWIAPEFYQGFLRASLFIYGSLDNEVTTGWWRQYAQSAQGGETDVIRIPFGKLVSNLVFGSVLNGYTGGIISGGKFYFSTLENSPGGTKYKFYKWFPVGLGFSTPTHGVYETQTQMFSKRQKINEVRIYGEPWLTGVSFKIDLIGSDGNIITNGTKTFTAGTNLTVGEDFAWYNPAIDKVYAVGLRITNLGDVNFVINKIELDISPGGE